MDSSLSVFIVGVVIGYTVGAFVVLLDDSIYTEMNIVEAGCGEYDRTTGEFILKVKE
jgi:hypothetical protein